MKKILYKFLSKIFLDGCSSYNSLSVRQKTRSKMQSRNAFKKLKLPFAKGDVFINPLKTFLFLKNNSFPLVVKPNIGGFSRGAYFPINTKMQLFFASIFVKIWWPSSIIEKYLHGKNYRVVVIKNEVMSVLERFAPFIVGDGEKTISNLIDIENNIRIKKKLLPTMSLISKNKNTKKYLKQQNLTLNSITAKNTIIYLHNKISLSNGGVIKIIDKNIISPNNKKKLLQVLNHFNANILGIDVICNKGLDIDFNKQKCIFLEVNSRCFLKMHKYPRYGKKENLKLYYDKLNKLNINDNETF